MLDPETLKIVFYDRHCSKSLHPHGQLWRNGQSRIRVAYRRLFSENEEPDQRQITIWLAFRSLINSMIKELLPYDPTDSLANNMFSEIRQQKTNGLDVDAQQSVYPTRCCKKNYAELMEISITIQRLTCTQFVSYSVLHVRANFLVLLSMTSSPWVDCQFFHHRRYRTPDTQCTYFARYPAGWLWVRSDIADASNAGNDLTIWLDFADCDAVLLGTLDKDGHSDSLVD